MASAFETHLQSEPVIWTGPVSKHFKHSSLFYYLRRPVETFSAGGEGPGPGDYLVLFSDEHAELMAGLPFEVEIVDRRPNRGVEFTLARVLAPARASPRD